MKTLYFLLSLPLIFTLFACSNLYNMNTVSNLNINLYSGKWYEIARLPNPFESNLHNICAFYTPRLDDEIAITNIGYDSNNKLHIATAIAFPIENDYAKMRISFFFPFFGDYAVTYLADDYSCAIVESPPYLWILARKNKLDPKTLNSIIENLKNQNIDTSKLIYVKHFSSAEDHPLYKAPYKK